MIDKIRLNLAGVLPPEYAVNQGESNPRLFDARCCAFLGVKYADLVKLAREGSSDEEILAWCEQHGRRPTEEDCQLWNGAMSKLGWRDEASERLQQRIREYGLEGQGIETYFDLFDKDEGR